MSLCHPWLCQPSLVLHSTVLRMGRFVCDRWEPSVGQMCCSTWARGGKGLSGLGASRVWSRATLEPNLSCHNKMMRSGPERLKSCSKCTRARALPSSCWEQNLLQKAAGHPILASSQRSRPSGAPPVPPALSPSCWHWALISLLHPRGLCRPPALPQHIWGCARWCAVFSGALWGHGGTAFSGCPIPSPQLGCAPRVPSLQTLGGTRTPWHRSCSQDFSGGKRRD